MVKKDGKREPFDRQKLLHGILKACEKRPVPFEELERLVDRVEKDLRNRMDQEVSSAEIGELVMDGLREIDEVAYVRFASVYRQFTDVDKFMQELQAIIRQKKD